MDTLHTHWLDQHYSISDDSGFLALVNPDAYESFVDDQWSLPQLLRHFIAQMRAHRLLIWGTGQEAVWRVRISSSSNDEGYRTVTGSINATQGRLLLASYDDLSMAAQFNDVRLPEPHQQSYVINVPPGTYACRITQMVAPEHAPAQAEAADFVLELRPIPKSESVWEHVPWFEDAPKG